MEGGTQQYVSIDNLLKTFQNEQIFRENILACKGNFISKPFDHFSPQCLRMDLNKNSGSKQKTIAGSKGTH